MLNISCSLKAHVRTSDNRIVESNLYNSLLSFLNKRADANKYYGISKNEQFRLDYSDRLEYDELDEPTFESFREVAKFSIDIDKSIKTLNREIKSGIYDYSTAASKMLLFNSKHTMSKDFLATLERLDNGNYKVHIVENTEKSREVLNNTIENELLIQRINTLLESYGVNTLFLNGNFYGKYSTEEVKLAVNGFYTLVQLCNNNTNIAEHYAEEAGHFSIGALGKHALIRRMEDILLNPEVQRELFKEDFDTKDFGKNPIREMMGDLVGRALLNRLKESKNDSSNISSFKKLMKRFIDNLKSLFKNLNPDKVSYHIEKANLLADEIAQGIINHSYDANIENALSTLETLFSRSLDKKKSDLKSFYSEGYPHTKDILNNINNFSKIVTEFEKLDKELALLNLGKMSSKSYFKRELPIYQSKLYNIQLLALQDLKSAENIALQLISQATRMVLSLADDVKVFGLDSTNYLNADTTGQTVLTDLLEKKIFRNLRRLIVTMNAIENVYKILNEYSKDPSSRNISIIDSSGNKVNFDLSSANAALKASIDLVNTMVEKSALLWYIKFLEKVYGKLYILVSARTVFAHGHLPSSLEELRENLERFKSIHSYNRWHALYKTTTDFISINDIVTGLGSYNVEDISLYASWLSSMQDCGDIILGICKKAINLAHRQTIKDTERERFKLNQLSEEAKLKGVVMNSNLFKKRDGKLTHYLLARFDYGKWEDNLNNLRKLIRDEFKQHLDSKGNDYAAKLYSKDKDTYNTLFIKYSERRIKEWHKANSHWNKEKSRYEPNVEDRDGKINYTDSEYFNLRAEERLILEKYFEWKDEIESKVGNNCSVPWRAPLNKGSFRNRVKNREGKLLRYSRTIIDTFIDNWISTVTPEDMYAFGLDSDTDEFESDLYNLRSNDLLNINRIGVLGMRKRARAEDLNTDLISSSYQYALSCNRKIALDNIVNALEVGKKVLMNRKILGVKESDFGNTHSNSYDSYIRNIDRALYNKLPIMRTISINNKANLMLLKLMNNIKSIGTLLCLGFNHNPAVVNLGTGFNEIMKEAGSSEFFNYKDALWAHEMFTRSRFANLSSMVSGNLFNENAGKSSIFENKIGRFLMYMDALNNYAERIDKSKRGWAANLLKDAPFFGYSWTDNYMLGIPFLAMAHNIALYDTKEDKMVNLTDIYDYKYQKDLYLNIVKDAKGNPIIEDYGFEPYRYTVYKDAKELGSRLNKMLITLHNDVIIDKSESAWNKLFDDNIDIIQEIFDKLHIELVKDVTLVNKVLNDARDKLYWSSSSETDFIGRAREIADRLHGIYSKIDSVNLLGTPYGNSLLSMKGYLLGMVERRFSSNYFNTILDLTVEGSYISMTKMLLDKDINKLTRIVELLTSPIRINKLELELLSKGYDKNLIANIRRTGLDIWFGTIMFAISSFLGSILKTLIAAANDDDDEDEDKMNAYSLFWKPLKYNRLLGFTTYITYKMFTEQAAFLWPYYLMSEYKSATDLMPVGISSFTSVLGDAFKMLGATYTWMFDMLDYYKPERDDFDTEDEYKDALKQWRSECNKLFGVLHNPIELDELNLSWYNLKPVLRFMKDIPTPLKHLFVSSDYEKNIESDKFYKSKLVGH